jgi:hypothetical protein
MLRVGGVLSGGSGGGAAIAAVAASQPTAGLGHELWRTAPAALPLSGKKPSNGMEAAGSLEKACPTIGRLPVKPLEIVPPQGLGTPVATKRVTALPSAETSNSTVPPVAAAPV